MSHWGYIDGSVAFETERHVIPCDENGFRIGKHSISRHCRCKPKREENPGLVIWVHQDRERGGHNG